MIEYFTKQSVRKKILILLRSQKEEERVEKSGIICDKLFRVPEFERARTIFFYASFDGEVETFEMIKKAKKLGKKIGLPRVFENKISPAFVEYLDQDLENGSFGIQQPKKTCPKIQFLGDIDAVVVPGVAFDKHNNRLGRGGGYYDRFLKALPSNILTIGLAFDFQVVDQLSQIEPHDVPVSFVVTN